MLNVAVATLKALSMLKNAQDLAQMRGKDAAELQPFWVRREQRNG